MIRYVTMGGIFILKRNLIISVAFVVAWFLLISLVAVNGSKRNYYIVEENIIANADVNIETENDTDKLEENEILEERDVSTPTSRSGSRTSREEQPEVYFEEIDLTLTEEEIEIFERIVEAEVGGTNYDGKLAVANVILNRVQSERFPNTLKEVVFANRQFSPISDGRYYTVKVSETTKQVVQDALNGSRIVEEDVYYFCTPTAPGRGWFETDLRKVGYIAPHNFYGYK